MTGEFAFKWRVIEAWHEPDAPSYLPGADNIFTWAEMLDPKPNSPLSRWVEQVRQWGFNGLNLFAGPEQNPPAMRLFARYLKEQGIGLIIRREWNEIERGYSWPPARAARPTHRQSALTLCPYNDDVQTYWARRVAKDFEMMPDLAGYRVNATEFYAQNGAPWMCDCRTCRTKTGQARTRDAIRLLADLLAPYGGTLFWETCQDDPWGQRHELHYFRDLTGVLPENARVVIKWFYWDFHPRWPRHPLFDVITPDAQGRSPYMTTIQEPGEYRGYHMFPWSMVDEWKDTFRAMVATGQQGLWVMAASVSPDGWDHPLNMVNWHAISTYLRDPQAAPAAIKREWAEQNFGREAAPVVVDVVDRMTEAARGMYEFDALWTASHSLFPTLEYLDSHLCGPYRQIKRMAGMMGLALPLDMYSPEREAEIRNDRRTRMVFNQVPITAALKAEALSQKDRAVRLVEEAIGLWGSLKGQVEESRYQKILAGLKGNRDDALIFRHMLDLYLDWKLGVLTEAKLDGVLAAAHGLHGVVMPEPLADDPTGLAPVGEAESLRTLAEKLRRDLREPWVEAYWVDHPLGEGVVVSPASPEAVVETDLGPEGKRDA